MVMIMMGYEEMRLIQEAMDLFKGDIGLMRKRFQKLAPFWGNFNNSDHWNIEPTDEGVRVCAEAHDRSEACQWVYYRFGEKRPPAY